MITKVNYKGNQARSHTEEFEGNTPKIFLHPKILLCPGKFVLHI